MGLFSRYHQQPCLATASSKEKHASHGQDPEFAKGKLYHLAPVPNTLAKGTCICTHTPTHTRVPSHLPHTHTWYAESQVQNILPQERTFSTRHSLHSLAVLAWLQGLLLQQQPWALRPTSRGPGQVANASRGSPSRSRSTAPAQPLWRLVPTVGVVAHPSQALQGS